MDILKEGDKIMRDRSASYGPSDDTNTRAAEIASVILQKKITCDDIYVFEVALKLARESFTHKEDNFLDGVCYMKLWNDHRNKLEELKKITVKND